MGVNGIESAPNHGEVESAIDRDAPVGFEPSHGRRQEGLQAPPHFKWRQLQKKRDAP